MRFEDKNALVTGGARGIGAATAERLASEGARVVVADFDEDGARATAERIGGGAVGVRCDVTRREEVEAAVEAAVSQAAARHPRHVRGDHPRQPALQDDRRRLGRRHRHAPQGHVLRGARGAGAHGRAEVREDRARSRRPPRSEPRPDELLRREGRAAGDDEDARDRARARSTSTSTASRRASSRRR